MILAIDTATRSASLAVHDGAAVRAEFTWDTSDHHTVELMPRIVEMLAQINVTIDQLSGLGVSIGPGSFTGVRVGVALAKGLAVSRNIPIVGVRSTDILAQAVNWCKPPLVIVVRAGRNRLIAARYTKTRSEWQPDGDFFLTTAELDRRALGSPHDVGRRTHGGRTRNHRAALRRSGADVGPGVCAAPRRLSGRDRLAANPRGCDR